MTTRSQAERTAVRKSLEFVGRVKKDVDLRKARDRAKIVAADKYDTSEFVGRLVLAGKAQKVLNRVNAAIREGRLDATALDREKLREIAGEGLKDYQANLLMRNTLATAYNAGYLEQGLADRTKAFWLYQTKRDGLVRPSHARWEGLLLAKGDPLAKRIFPPNGHNCRCKMTAVSRDRAKALLADGQATLKKPELKTKTYVDKVTGKRIRTLEGIDPGWEGTPDDRGAQLGKLLEEQLERIGAMKPGAV